MKLGAQINLFARYGDLRYKKMKEHGFDYADYAIYGALDGKTEEEYEQLVLREKALAEEAGVTIWQIHGPWRYPPHDETEEDRAEWASYMRRSIRLTALIGCKYWVIHPIMPYGPNADPEPEIFWQMNLDFFRDILVTAKEYGVIICFENMPMRKLSMSTPEQTLKFIHMIDDENFKLCLDTGHASVFKLSPAEAVRMAGKDLAVMHVHDNGGDRDAHFLPFQGIIDWKDYVAALEEIGFDGVFSLEASIIGWKTLPFDAYEKMLEALDCIMAELFRK